MDEDEEGNETGFNPRLRTGGDATPVWVGVWGAGFNPRLRTGGDEKDQYTQEADLGFNPRLRTGGDFHCSSACQSAFQFQSTPPHGRRQGGIRGAGALCGVSIHASAREATCFLLKNLMSSATFQSTPPHGRRHPQGRRVTVAGESFNPRLRTGGDPRLSSSGLTVSAFQSTPPHGRRQR